MPLFGDLADNDFANKLSDHYAQHVGAGEFKNIREEAKRDNPAAQLWLGGPLIQRGIQGGRKNRSMSGIQAAIELGASDIVRVGKFLGSPRGLLHLLTRFGQSKMQPYVGGGTNPITIANNKLNRNFNPLTIPLQGAASVLGIHVHPLFGFGGAPSYLLDTKARNIAGVAELPKIGNRLIDLQIKYMGTSGYSAFPGKVGLPGGQTPPATPFTGGPGVISLSPGGPNSLFGFGATGIFKSDSGNTSFDATVYYQPGFPYDPTDPSTSATNPSIKHFNPLTSKAISVPENIDELAKSEPSKDIAQYKTLAYGNLKKSDNSTLIQDFRKKSNHHKVALPNYQNQNISTRLGIPNYGERRGTNKRPNPKSDLVTFQLGSQRLWAFIQGAITDAFAFNFSEVKYVGAITPSYVYDTGQRSWSLTLIVPSFTAVELRDNTKVINKLIQECSPSVKDSRGVGKHLNLTLGDFWKNLPTIIDKVDVTIEDTTPWDIGFGAKGETTKKELPMHYTLALSGKFLQNVSSGIKAYNI